ncbi:hypothetical protein [Kitasatospora sp. NBC_01266]|uniref:hypothetical protein n=1 Tax=Kitasatospora sp. NBC_01266 TaxID=2903572 RepID=UPI002E34BF98|nr:hypothetical protein [Kitasatospora sp. NBC_01266]
MDRREFVKNAVREAVSEVGEASSDGARDKRAAGLAAVREAIAKTSGLPLGLADRLNGSTEAEIRADADRLIETIKAMPANLNTRPKSLLPSGGPVDPPPTLDIDPMKLAASVLARRLAG